MLDVADDLQRDGFRVTRVPVLPQGDPDAGVVDLQRLAETVDDETAMVSVMWANNEIGAIAPMSEIAEIAHRHGALLHSDATQAVGRIPVDVMAADVDLLSASAHKFYGPKGTGILVVGNTRRRVRLRPQIIGGGQQNGIRSGTMNPAGTVGLATALRIGAAEMSEQNQRVQQLRDQLWQRLSREVDGAVVNGPSLTGTSRLPGNLNFHVPGVEGQAWMSAVPELAFSSGSACSDTHAAPSHVLSALGLSESEARRSVRLGVGRFNTREEMEDASIQLIAAYSRLASLVP